MRDQLLRCAVQEKPYPENGGFYGMGALREMGLRKSRHSGDWRTKSEFKNTEEEFVQPLRGTDTVLQKGTTIRGAGGERTSSAKTGDGAGGGFQEPKGGQAPTSHNVAIIRSLGSSLALPKSVQERRVFEEVSATGFPLFCRATQIQVAYSSHCASLFCNAGTRRASQPRCLSRVGNPLCVQGLPDIHYAISALFLWACPVAVDHAQSCRE